MTGQRLVAGGELAAHPQPGATLQVVRGSALWGSHIGVKEGSGILVESQLVTVAYRLKVDSLSPTDEFLLAFCVYSKIVGCCSTPFPVFPDVFS